MTVSPTARPDPVGPVRFEVVWGVSASSWPLYDTADAERAIGFVPTQRSEIPEAEWRKSARL